MAIVASVLTLLVFYFLVTTYVTGGGATSASSTGSSSSSATATSSAASTTLLLSTSFSSGSRSSTSSSSPTTTASTGNFSADYDFFIAPNLGRVEMIREWFMSPFNASAEKVGYDSAYGMVRGGFWSGGFQDGYVLIDSQLLVGSTLDYLNAIKGIHTDIVGNTSKWLDSTTFVDPSNGDTGTYNGTDRREIMFGNLEKCVYNTTGQVYYAPGHTLNDTYPITTALPTSCTSDGVQAMSTYALWIELYYLEGNTLKAQAMFNATLSGWTSTTGTGIGNTTGGYFNDTFDSGPDQGKCKSSRVLGYWLEMARATGFWNDNDQSRTMATQVMDELWAHQLPGGSISVNYPGCKNDLKNSVESSGTALLAFDPRVPTWFEHTAAASARSHTGGSIPLLPPMIRAQFASSCLIRTSEAPLSPPVSGRSNIPCP